LVDLAMDATEIASLFEARYAALVPFTQPGPEKNWGVILALRDARIYADRESWWLASLALLIAERSVGLILPEDFDSLALEMIWLAVARGQIGYSTSRRSSL
jgi:hypothetical protein